MNSSSSLSIWLSQYSKTVFPSSNFENQNFFSLRESNSLNLMFFCSFHHHHHLYMSNTARSLFELPFNINTRIKKTVIDRMTAEVIVDIIKFHKSSERKRQRQIFFALYFHRSEVYALFSTISFIVKHMTTMIKISLFYTMTWNAYYNDKRIMNKIMMSLNFDYHESNALFI